MSVDQQRLVAWTDREFKYKLSGLQPREADESSVTAKLSDAIQRGFRACDDHLDVMHCDAAVWPSRARLAPVGSAHARPKRCDSSWRPPGWVRGTCSTAQGSVAEHTFGVSAGGLPSGLERFRAPLKPSDDLGSGREPESVQERALGLRRVGGRGEL